MARTAAAIVLVIDNDNCLLYEMFDAHAVNGGQSWDAGSGAVFNLYSNALRPDFWTSADAAGLPIFAGLARYSEVVEQGVIDHALRFTVSQTRRAFIHPATHFASSITDTNVPPMGLRFRMKASYDCSPYRPEVQVICAALKKYGMMVADNGADWFISGAPDDRWNDDALVDLKRITGDAFEVVNTGEPTITDSGVEPPPSGPVPAPPPAPPVPPEANTPSSSLTASPSSEGVPPSPDATASGDPQTRALPPGAPRSPDAPSSVDADRSGDGTGGSGLPRPILLSAALAIALSSLVAAVVIMRRRRHPQG